MNKQKWGIWGIGIVGTSAIRHLHTQEHELSAYDAQTPTEEQRALLSQYDVRFISDKQRFLEENDYILPSPGVDISQESGYLHKMRNELDLFLPLWKKPLIGVTGSLGKTTLVTALNQILSVNNLSVATGGNIGTPLLDLLANDTADYALLELSSFQLEAATNCSPELAILTNIHPNHLDRHRSLDEYFSAKYNLFKFQKPCQKALVPLSLASRFSGYTNRPLFFFSTTEPTDKESMLLKEGDTVYWCNNDSLVIYTLTHKQLERKTIVLSEALMAQKNKLLPETLICLIAACDLLKIDMAKIPDIAVPQHRLEYIGTYKDILLYNDSKATIMEATHAAVTTLNNRPIHLLLGGLGKGVDRAHYVKSISSKVSSIACFGDEAKLLAQSCIGTASTHKGLKGALEACIKRAQPGDSIILSPGGASFDLYKNYVERGNHFKQLVLELE